MPLNTNNNLLSERELAERWCKTGEIIRKLRKSGRTPAHAHLVKSPLIFTLNIPITVIYCAIKLANANVSSQILFGVIGVSALIFSAWVIKQFITNGIGR